MNKYEQDMYRDVGRLAKALERLVKMMEKIIKAQEAE